MSRRDCRPDITDTPTNVGKTEQLTSREIGLIGPCLLPCLCHDQMTFDCGLPQRLKQTDYTMPVAPVMPTTILSRRATAPQSAFFSAFVEASGGNIF
jgi:hypothetical protein